MLIDTDVLIWFLRGQSSAQDAIAQCSSVELSAVTYMELVQGVRDKEELRMLRRTIRLNDWRILPLAEDVSHRATMSQFIHPFENLARHLEHLLRITSFHEGIFGLIQRFRNPTSYEQLHFAR